jgi:hypothetical protein
VSEISLNNLSGHYETQVLLNRKKSLGHEVQNEAELTHSRQDKEQGEHIVVLEEVFVVKKVPAVH